MTKIFPIVEEKLRKKGITLTVIDLRWGVTEEQIKKGHTIEICLQEVERCYPYFIGILGGRYGWIPTLEDMKIKDKEFYKNYSEKIKKYIEDKKSITEMEVRFGVLERPNQIESHFYFGDENVYFDKLEYYRHYSGLTKEQQKSLMKMCQEKQKVLKNTIVKKGLNVGGTFKDAITLGNMILNDLEAMIERKFGHLEDLSEEERIYLNELSFEKQKTIGYVQREETKALNEFYYEVIDDQIKEIQTRVVCGKSGIGKTTLVSKWIQDIEKENETIKILRYYVGIDGRIQSDTDILKLIMSEIKETYDVQEELPDVDYIHMQFFHWLTYINQPTIIVIDGINQLDRSSQTLHWLPNKTYNCVGVLLTLTGTKSEPESKENSSAFEVALKRELKIIEVKGFEEEKIKCYINRYLRKKGKEDNKYLKQIISSSNPLCQNPLYLNLVMDTMIRFGNELEGNVYNLNKMTEFFSEQTNLYDVFDLLFNYYSHEYSEELLDYILGMIYLSRKGLYRREIETIVIQQLGYNAMDFNGLFSILENYLFCINGQYQIYHDYVKKSVEIRIADKIEAIGQVMITYFQDQISNQAITKHIAEELTHQLKLQEKWFDLFEVISNKDIFKLICEDYKDEIISYFKHFNKIGFDYDYLVNKLVNFRDINIEDSYLNDLGILLNDSGNFSQAINLYKKIEVKQINKYGEDYPDLWPTWHNMATVYNVKGDYELAIELYKKVAEKQLNKYGEEYPRLWITWNNMALAYNYKGEYDKATELLKKVAEKQLNKYGEEYPRLWITWNNMALVYKDKGDYEVAIELYKKVAEKLLNYQGEEHPVLWIVWNDIALAYYGKGDYDTAIEWYKKVAEKFLIYRGEEYPVLWTTWMYIALTCNKKGDYDTAIELYKKVAEKFLIYRGEEYPGLWIVWNNIALAYYGKGDYDKAIELYKKVAEKQLNKYGENYTELWTVWANIAGAYYGKGDYDTAIGLYKKVAEKWANYYGEDYPELLKLKGTLEVLIRKTNQDKL